MSGYAFEPISEPHALPEVRKDTEKATWKRRLTITISEIAKASVLYVASGQEAKSLNPQKISQEMYH